jgi:hypothetical protein
MTCEPSHLNPNLRRTFSIFLRKKHPNRPRPEKSIVAAVNRRFQTLANIRDSLPYHYRTVKGWTRIILELLGISGPRPNYSSRLSGVQKTSVLRAVKRQTILGFHTTARLPNLILKSS